MSLSSELKETLKTLAQTYETADFLNDDPSRFLRWYSDPADVEAAAFIAAMLSFGSRKQFIPKIQEIFELADAHGGMKRWLTDGNCGGDFRSFAEKSGCGGNYNRKFYRFYSYEDMISLFERMGGILKKSGTFGECVYSEWRASPEKHLAEVVSGLFSGCVVVPQGKTSANKRIHMYLRWMVRRNSPVDLGLWNWYSPADLILPLDTHVIQESIRLGLIPEKSSATLKTARAVTNSLKEIWQDDPCKGDFALFGLGVDQNKNDE